MVDRVVIGTRPLGVEYRISALGQTLQDLIDALLRWTSAHMADVTGARDRFDRGFEE